MKYEETLTEIKPEGGKEDQDKTNKDQDDFFLNLSEDSIAKMIGYSYFCNYSQTSNPLFVFASYRKYRERNLTIPNWILEYFDTVTESLLEEDENRVDGIPGGERPQFTVYNVLGMKRCF